MLSFKTTYNTILYKKYNWKQTIINLNVLTTLDISAASVIKKNQRKNTVTTLLFNTSFIIVSFSTISLCQAK